MPFRAIAELIGRRVTVPVAAVAAEEAGAHLGLLAHLVGLDMPASKRMTRELLGWQPTQLGLIGRSRPRPLLPLAIGVRGGIGETAYCLGGKGAVNASRPRLSYAGSASAGRRRPSSAVWRIGSR